MVQASGNEAGTVLETFDSQDEAALAFGCSASKMSMLISQNTQTRGVYFRRLPPSMAPQGAAAAQSPRPAPAAQSLHTSSMPLPKMAHASSSEPVQFSCDVCGKVCCCLCSPAFDVCVSLVLGIREGLDKIRLDCRPLGRIAPMSGKRPLRRAALPSLGTCVNARPVTGRRLQPYSVKPGTCYRLSTSPNLPLSTHTHSGMGVLCDLPGCLANLNTQGPRLSRLCERA